MGFSPVELVLLLPVQVQPFHGVADGGFEESQLYYTTPNVKIPAENAGNARETPRIIDRTSVVGAFPSREGVFRRSA